MWSLARMEQFSFHIKSSFRALKLCAVYRQSCKEFLTILGTTAV